MHDYSLASGAVLLCLTCRTVFDTLYTLLSFGHETPESAAQIDPPSSYFRYSTCVRMLCVSPIVTMSCYTVILQANCLVHNVINLIRS